MRAIHSSVKIEAYCACGGAVRGTVGGDPAKAQQTVDVFRQIHQKEGCRPCDSRTARKARQKGKSDA